MTSLERCTEASNVLTAARDAGLFPNIGGLMITGGDDNKGEFFIAIRDLNSTQAPPTYHEDLLLLFAARGYGDVEFYYRYREPAVAR